MSLGGDGGLNLPFEPNDRVDRAAPPEGWKLAAGVIVLAITFDHPLTGKPHPGLVLRLSHGDGTYSGEYLLVMEPHELAALPGLVEEAVQRAITFAQGARP